MMRLGFSYLYSASILIVYREVEEGGQAPSFCDLIGPVRAGAGCGEVRLSKDRALGADDWLEGVFSASWFSEQRMLVFGDFT